jgi:hypothetical protein
MVRRPQGSADRRVPNFRPSPLVGLDDPRLGADCLPRRDGCRVLGQDLCRRSADAPGVVLRPGEHLRPHQQHQPGGTQAPRPGRYLRPAPRGPNPSPLAPGARGHGRERHLPHRRRRQTQPPPRLDGPGHRLLLGRTYERHPGHRPESPARVPPGRRVPVDDRQLHLRLSQPRRQSDLHAPRPGQPHQH